MIKINNVSKHYGAFQVLTDCSTQVNKGEVVVVCGPSGSGKSTLIKCVNGLEPFQSGEIQVNGISVGDSKTNLSKLRSHVGMVFQHFELFPHLSIVENLTIAQIKVLGRGKDEATEKGMQLLDRVGLKAHAQKHPGQLSGGQQQRVAIARALVQEPDIVLADEPIASLDPRNTKVVMDALQHINRHLGITVICNLHSLDLARGYCDRLVGMSAGRVVFDDVPAALTDATARDLYGLEAGDVIGHAPPMALPAGVQPGFALAGS